MSRLIAIVGGTGPEGSGLALRWVPIRSFELPLSPGGQGFASSQFPRPLMVTQRNSSLQLKMWPKSAWQAASSRQSRAGRQRPPMHQLPPAHSSSQTPHCPSFQ